jgi:serine/threonine protein kinase
LKSRPIPEYSKIFTIVFETVVLYFLNMSDDTTPRISIEPDKEPREEPHPSSMDKTVAIPRKPAQDIAPPPAEMKSLYKLVTRIGDGGMGVVFLAQDRRLGRYVAIKRLNRTSLLHPKLKERFLREAKAIAALNHIHIVHIYALGEDTEGPYIVMEYIPGPRIASRNPAR